MQLGLNILREVEVLKFESFRGNNVKYNCTDIFLGRQKWLPLTLENNPF